MNTRFKNQDKMKNFLETYTGEKLSAEEFQDHLDYFVEFADYINEETDGLYNIREGASLELEIKDEHYEVWVKYDSVVENNQRSMLIDFDYSYPPFRL
jgi:hypothetical protein